MVVWKGESSWEISKSCVSIPSLTRSARCHSLRCPVGACIIRTMVSQVTLSLGLQAGKEFKSTVEELIQVTDKQVLRSVHGTSHTTAESLAWATAQRGNPFVSIEASIELVSFCYLFYTCANDLLSVGRDRMYTTLSYSSLLTSLSPGYWKGLISSTDFTGKKLRQCLDVIHTDIISVWNIRDPHKVRPGYHATLCHNRYSNPVFGW